MGEDLFSFAKQNLVCRMWLLEFFNVQVRLLGDKGFGQNLFSVFFLRVFKRFLKLGGVFIEIDDLLCEEFSLITFFYGETFMLINSFLEIVWLFLLFHKQNKNKRYLFWRSSLPSTCEFFKRQHCQNKFIQN
eukprot:TRINITY_DN2113_c0_g1_i5.p4 TRINITY_DN2113_c0_g1~~TRINITY_DN2113_c0_g1_i5.p4  ORF type:complete len:132 (+),score=5.68 TRINITY_DN2113_c0_g1_i5:665-1060(+)